AGFADACETLVRDVDAWYPVSAIADEDTRTLVARIVRRRVADLCAETPMFRDRSCYAAATDVDEERACVDAQGAEVFPRGDRDGLAARLAQLAAIRDDADEIACPRVAEAYYSNIHWAASASRSLTGTGGARDLDAEQAYTPDLMVGYRADELDQLIAASRDAFARACEQEGWSVAVRACLRTAPSGSLETECLAGIDGTPAPARRWTTPPLELVRTYDDACDAYLAAVRDAATCPASRELVAPLATAVPVARSEARTRASRKADKEAQALCHRLHAQLTAAAAPCLAAR
ncbi:MAG: hypothetical protein KC464_17485, partial [Myxococcales bacterium]|nr:hypothetical protein [Myxococcales bacterium]